MTATRYRAARPEGTPRPVMAAVAMVATVAAGALALSPGTAAGHASPGAGEVTTGYAQIVIGPGETAWEALKPHAPEEAHHTVFVHEVLRANDVDARSLRPGDVLAVPSEVGS